MSTIESQSQKSLRLLCGNKRGSKRTHGEIIVVGQVRHEGAWPRVITVATGRVIRCEVQ